MSEKELKAFEAMLKKWDNRIDNNVNAKLLYHLSIKWQSLSIIVAIVLTVMALQSAALFYVNDRTIKSSIKTSMADYKESIAGLEKTLVSHDKTIKDLEKNVNKQMKLLFKILVEQPWEKK